MTGAANDLSNYRPPQRIRLAAFFLRAARSRGDVCLVMPASGMRIVSNKSTWAAFDSESTLAGAGSLQRAARRASKQDVSEAASAVNAIILRRLAHSTPDGATVYGLYAGALSDAAEISAVAEHCVAGHAGEFHRAEHCVRVRTVGGAWTLVDDTGAEIAQSIKSATTQDPREIADAIGVALASHERDGLRIYPGAFRFGTVNKAGDVSVLASAHLAKILPEATFRTKNLSITELVPNGLVDSAGASIPASQVCRYVTLSCDDALTCITLGFASGGTQSFAAKREPSQSVIETLARDAIAAAQAAARNGGAPDDAAAMQRVIERAVTYGVSGEFGFASDGLELHVTPESWALKSRSGSTMWEGKTHSCAKGTATAISDAVAKLAAIREPTPQQYRLSMMPPSMPWALHRPAR